MKITRKDLKNLILKEMAGDIGNTVIELHREGDKYVLKDDNREFHTRIVVDEPDEVAGALVALQSYSYTHVFVHEEREQYTIGNAIRKFDTQQQHTVHYDRSAEHGNRPVMQSRSGHTFVGYTDRDRPMTRAPDGTPFFDYRDK